MSRITKRPNRSEETPEGIIIHLTLDQICLIDLADYEQVKKHRWHTQERGGIYYATTTIKTQDGTTTSWPMHRFLMNLGTSDERRVCHLNGNSLDNRRENLRIATHQEIMSRRKKSKGTSSKFRGVYWHKLQKKWQALIVIDGVLNLIGTFESEVEAARAYDDLALYLFGTGTKLNRRKVTPKMTPNLKTEA